MTNRDLRRQHAWSDHRRTYCRQGLLDELNDRSYVVIDGLDRRGHYDALGRQADVQLLAIGGVEIRDARPRAADRELLAHARDGIYDTREAPRRIEDEEPLCTQDAADFVTAHGRGLEARDALASSNYSPMGGGECRVICSVRGRASDAQRSAEQDVRVVSELPIERQALAIGATWLDRQLVDEPTVIPK